MESQVFDTVKFEKDKAIARYNLFRRIARLRQVFEVLVVFGLISWSSARFPAVLRASSVYLVAISTYLFNYHVVFLIGNAIIVLLFFLCRRNEAADCVEGGSLYNDYVKHSEVARQCEPSLPPTPNTEVELVEEEKKDVICAETVDAVSECDDVVAAIEKATRQIERFQRTQSEILKRETGVRPRPELRRSETENRRKTISSGERFDAAEMESLSSEEFRRTVDAFIDKHWSNRKTKQNQLEENEKKHQLLKIARC